MQLFYHPSLSPESETLLFDKEESTHIYKVLRKKAGDTLHITDGKGYLYQGQNGFEGKFYKIFKKPFHYCYNLVQ